MYLYDMYMYMYNTSCPQDYLGEIKKFIPFPSYLQMDMYIHTCMYLYQP